MFVEVTEGYLKGEILQNALTSELYFSFKGIPFAKPPVGPLRFKNPVPPEKYKGVWDATQERSPCLQKNFLSTKLVGDEDCLYLNVYTPKLPKENDSLKPVMFYIYGGGYTEGRKDAFMFGPDFLVAKDVVLVVPNYRLHLFGFLNLGIDACPGNAGLKDQAAALKWTAANIRQFGGDPNNITIFGESAGGCAVLYLLYSPSIRGKGLFHKAIVQSGKIIHNVNVGSVDSSTDRAARLARKLGFDSEDPRELYHFFMTVPAPDLTSHLATVLTLEEKRNAEFFPFLPSVEIAGPEDERIVTTVGSELMKQDPGVPIMNGMCSQEAMIWLLEPLLLSQPVNRFAEIVEPLIIPRLCPNASKDGRTAAKVVEKIQQFYFQGKSSNEEKILTVIDLYSDLFNTRGYSNTNKAILKHSSQPLYPFLISFRPNMGMIEHAMNYRRPAFLQGASHADELAYLFLMKLREDKDPLGTKTDKKIINLMTTVWTNFAKYSDPCKGLPVNLKPLNSTERSYLDINQELTVKNGLIFEKRVKFIDDLSAFFSTTPAYCLRKM